MSTPPPISYESTERGVSRRAFRFLLFLTLINTILLGVFVLGPGLGGFLRQQWAAYEQRQADRKRLAAHLSAQQQCMNYRVPPDTLLYAEDLAGSAALRAIGPVNTIGISPIYQSGFFSRWTGPVVTYDPGCLKSMTSIANLASAWQQNSGWLFLHERRAITTSPPRLILVRVSTSPYFDNQIAENNDVTQVRMNRVLSVLNFAPATAEEDIKIAATDLLSIGFDPKDATVPITWDSGDGHGPQQVDFHGQLRFFAGQADDSDPSRFTLPYTLDGVRGTIVGKLFDNDHVRFETSGPLAPFVH